MDVCTLFHYHQILNRLQVRAGPLLPSHACLLIRSFSKSSLSTYVESGPVLSPGGAAGNSSGKATPSGAGFPVGEIISKYEI